MEEIPTQERRDASEPGFEQQAGQIHVPGNEDTAAKNSWRERLRPRGEGMNYAEISEDEIDELSEIAAFAAKSEKSVVGFASILTVMLNQTSIAASELKRSDRNKPNIRVLIQEALEIVLCLQCRPKEYSTAP